MDGEKPPMSQVEELKKARGGDVPVALAGWGWGGRAGVVGFIGCRFQECTSDYMQGPDSERRYMPEEIVGVSRLGGGEGATIWAVGVGAS